MSDNIGVKSEKIINILLKGTIFLLPLFFLPWTGEHFEFNKQFLLWLIAPAAGLLWFLKTVVSGKLKIKTNPLNLPVLIFLFLSAAAAFLSLDGFSSFFGYFGRFSDAWLGLLSLVILYFLIINTDIADNSKKITDLLKLFFYSPILVALLSLLAILGVFKVVAADSQDISLPAFFNLAGGSILILGVFLSIIIVALAGFLFTDAPSPARRINRGPTKINRFFYGAGLAAALIVLIFINFYLSWLLLLLGAVPIIFFGWLKSGSAVIKNRYLSIPATLVLLSLIFLAWPQINPAKIIIGQDLPREILLSYDQSFLVARKTIKKYPALGSGPGTFPEDFSLYRPVELNRGPLWQLRFQKSTSQIIELLATTGLLTLLGYLLVISLVIYLNIILIREYFKRRDWTDEDNYLFTGLFTVFILIFFSQLLFYSATVLNFMFWFYLSLLMVFWHNRQQALFKEKIINFLVPVLYYRLSWLVLLVLSVGWISLLLFEFKFFTADIIAARPANREINLKTAVKLNPNRYNYQISLAKLYLNKAWAEALKPVEQKNNSSVQLNIAQAIETGQLAQSMAPNSVLPYETLGMIYRDSRPLTLGGDVWAVKYFKQAFSLEPTNPVLATELAKAYSNNNDPVKAEQYFRQAVELKSDYYEAKFGLAKTYINSEKDNQALLLLNELARDVETPEVYYELGRLYYNRGEIDKAIDRFMLVLSLSPKHSNGLYSLAIAHEAEGNTKEALKYLEQVLELNPGNEEVINKIKTLKK